MDPGQELSNINFGSLIGGPLCAVIEAQSQAARATADFIKTVGFDEDNRPIYVEFKYPKEVVPYKAAQDARAEVGSGGSGYITAPVVTLVDGVTAATAVLEGGKVVRVDFTGAPTADGAVTFTDTGTGGSGATATWKKATPAVPAQYIDMKIEVPILTMLPIPFIRVEEATVDFNAKINSMETRAESRDMAIQGSLEVKQRWPSGSAKLNVSASYQKKTSSGSAVERTYSMQVHVRASQDEMPAGMEKLLALLEGAMKSTPIIGP